MPPQIKPIELIKANRLFEHLSESELKLTFNKPDLITVKEGEIIFRLGEAADQIYLILDGEVKVKQTIPNDVPRIFLKNKNDFLGEKEFLENTSRNSSAVADKNCLLYILRRKEINEMVSRNRKVWSNLQGESPVVNFDNDEAQQSSSADTSYEDYKKTRDEIREIMGLSGFEDPFENPEDLIVKEMGPADTKTEIQVEEENSNHTKDRLHFLKHTTIKFSETRDLNGRSQSKAENGSGSFKPVVPQHLPKDDEPEIEETNKEEIEDSSNINLPQHDATIAGVDDFSFNKENLTEEIKEESPAETPRLNLNFMNELPQISDEENKFNFGSLGTDTNEIEIDERKQTTEKFSWDFTQSSEDASAAEKFDDSKEESRENSAWNFTPSSELENKKLETNDEFDLERERTNEKSPLHFTRDLQEDISEPKDLKVKFNLPILDENLSWNFNSDEAPETLPQDKIKIPVSFEDAIPEKEKFSWNFDSEKDNQTEAEAPSVKDAAAKEEDAETGEEKLSWDFSTSDEAPDESPKINFDFDKIEIPSARAVEDENEDEILAEKEPEKVKLNLDLLSKNEDEFTGAGFETLNIPNIADEVKFNFDSETPFFKEKNISEKRETFEEIAKLNEALPQNQRTLSAEQLNLLISTTHSVNSTFKIDEVLRSIIDAATTLARADRGTLYIVDHEKKEIWSKIVRGDNIEEIRLNIGVGLAGWVAQTGETINIDDVSVDKRFNPEYDKLSGYQTRSMLCFPIKNKVGMVVGVLQLINSLAGKFTEIDEDFLEALSVNAALALEKAELFEQTLKTDRLTSLGKVSNFIIGDIKKPILTIKHFAEHIKKKNITPDVRQVLDMIIQQTNGVINLVQTALSYSEGKTILRSKVQSLNKVMDEILEQLAEYVELRSVKLFKKYDKDVFVNVDRRELYQAVYQITKNACDALPNGGNFYLSTKISGAKAEILMKDDGLGIPPSILPRVFEPFMSHGKKNGVGLGLCIAEKIVKEHEGEIQIDSVLGEGAEVKILLPIIK